MSKRNSSTGVFLEILNPGFGSIYYSKATPSNILFSIFSLLVTILLIAYVPSQTKFWGFTQAYFEVMFKMNEDLDHRKATVLIFWVFIIGVTRTFAIIAFFVKAHSINNTIENRYSSDKLIKELTKINILKKESIINNTDYHIRIDNILLDINKYGISETREDFLISIIPLKDSGIITQDVLDKLKKSLL
ncbi:MAG: hypothetical protein ACOYN6_00305 [Ignavibacteria bacterium]